MWQKDVGDIEGEATFVLQMDQEYTFTSPEDAECNESIKSTKKFRFDGKLDGLQQSGLSFKGKMISNGPATSGPGKCQDLTWVFQGNDWYMQREEAVLVLENFRILMQAGDTGTCWLSVLVRSEAVLANFKATCNYTIVEVQQ